MLKKETVLTYTRYLNHLRITQARMLLKNSDLIISKIAVMVGYNDVCHFNRTFKKMMGSIPASIEDWPWKKKNKVSILRL